MSELVKIVDHLPADDVVIEHVAPGFEGIAELLAAAARAAVAQVHADQAPDGEVAR